MNCMIIPIKLITQQQNAYLKRKEIQKEQSSNWLIALNNLQKVTGM